VKRLLLILLCLPLLFSCGDKKEKKEKQKENTQAYWQITLELEVSHLLKELSNNSTDADFSSAIRSAYYIKESNAQNKKDFLTLFGEEYEKKSPSKGMAALFKTQLKEKIKSTATNQAVMEVLKVEVEDAISSSFNILRARIDRFGVKQANIQRIKGTASYVCRGPWVAHPLEEDAATYAANFKESEREAIKNFYLDSIGNMGNTDPRRIKKLLCATGNLEFWETYKFVDLTQNFIKANKALLEINELPLANFTVDNLGDEEDVEEDVEDTKKGPLFAILTRNVVGPNNSSPVVGFCAVRDTAALNGYLKDDAFKKQFKDNVSFAYRAKASTLQKYQGLLELVALKSGRNGKPSMEGDAVEKASAQMDANNRWEISMTMNPDGAKKWKKFTAKNIGKSVAIVLDGYVYSYPTVQAEISGGRSSISGDFTQNEAKDLANTLKSGKLPVSLAIAEESIIEPSLVEE